MNRLHTLKESLEDAAMLYEQARGLAALKGIVANDYKNHPSKLFLLMGLESLRFEAYETATRLLEQALNSTLMRDSRQSQIDEGNSQGVPDLGEDI